MNNDLISRSELLKHTHGGDWDGVGFSKEYVYVDDIINVPPVEPEITEKQAILLLINSGWLVNHDKELREKWERPQVELANEVWELYEKYHSHLATHVIEFGDELKDLLSKYQKGGEKE